MKSRDETGASEPKSPAQSARRRLVSGALAVPVALTVRSGGAAAASFSCVYKQVVGDPARPANGAEDGWLRVPLWQLTLRNAEKSSTWISGSEIALLAKPGKSAFLSAGQWYCLSAGNNAKITIGGTNLSVQAGQEYSPPSTPAFTNQAGTTTTAVPSSSLFVAVRVDQDGHIVGVVDGSTGGGSSAVSDSCWSSFKG